MRPPADVENQRTTRTEKLLAGALVVFLLIAGVWLYIRIDDWTRDAFPAHYPNPQALPAVRAAEQARFRLDDAQVAVRRAEHRLVLTREAYRTALEAHRPTASALGRRYDRAHVTFARAQREAAAAQRAVRAAEPAAQRESQRAQSRYAAQLHDQDLYAFLLRLAFVLLALVGTFGLLARMRNRGSRYLPLAGAAAITAVLLALVLGGDYLTDYADPLRVGPLILAAFGVAICLAAFWGLQRYVARRLPHRRARRRQCPFCGYPVGTNERCEGRSREVVAPCERCSAPRRVGVPYCGACGQA